MCLHGALCPVLISLVCNMSTFRKNVLAIDLISGVEGACKEKNM